MPKTFHVWETSPELAARHRGLGFAKHMLRLKLADLRDHLVKIGLAGQKWPEQIRIVDEFQRTSACKIKEFVFRDALRAEPEPVRA